MAVIVVSRKVPITIKKVIVTLQVVVRGNSTNFRDKKQLFLVLKTGCLIVWGWDQQHWVGCLSQGHFLLVQNERKRHKETTSIPLT